jgi:hypothetical protein
MIRTIAAVGAASLVLTILPAAALAGSPAGAPRFGTPGSAGAGDAYFPQDGNGGYNVGHYDLRVRYQPSSGRLAGLATISARATQNLSAFNLDLVGLNVRAVSVDGRPATWSRAGQELTVRPRKTLRDDRRFTVVLRYGGVPVSLEGAGFIATDDGFDIVGEPHVAASWFPVNDHPTDKAAYTFRVTVPRGRQVVANGDLVDVDRHRGRATWTWHAPDPMASYLATVDVGEFQLDAYRRGGIRYLDAIDPDLFEPVAAPSTGTRFAVSQPGISAYKRLLRQIDVPAGGATVGFTMTRDTEADWDFVFVEAHAVGSEEWTTLPDANGNTADDPGFSCLVWPDLHPFISDHYMSVDQGAETCSPTNGAGEWWAASGASGGPEQWLVDLSAYAGSTVELSISYASDQSVPQGGVYVDDIVVSTGEGSTSFETGFDGWTVPGAPAGSPGNEDDWIIGTAADVPPPPGEFAAAAFARQPEIIGFESSVFGRYPWRSAGGIVDDVEGLGFALENQTRPVYSKGFFSDPESSDGVVVHELAHQWYGDSLAVKRWKEIWLNEGFATYAEWLWQAREGIATEQETFDFFYEDFIAPDDPWWDITIGDPGPDQLFEFPVYFRGAMTLHQLRLTVGDADFFRILRVWAQSRAGDNVATREFIRLSERISGQELHDLFNDWLYTPGRPELPTAQRASAPDELPATRPAGIDALIATMKLETSSRR